MDEQLFGHSGMMASILTISRRVCGNSSPEPASHNELCAIARIRWSSWLGASEWKRTTPPTWKPSTEATGTIVAPMAAALESSARAIVSSVSGDAVASSGGVLAARLIEPAGCKAAAQERKVRRHASDQGSARVARRKSGKKGGGVARTSWVALAFAQARHCHYEAEQAILCPQHFVPKWIACHVAVRLDPPKYLPSRAMESEGRAPIRHPTRPPSASALASEAASIIPLKALAARRTALAPLNLAGNSNNGARNGI